MRTREKFICLITLVSVLASCKEKNYIIEFHNNGEISSFKWIPEQTKDEQVYLFDNSGHLTDWYSMHETSALHVSYQSTGFLFSASVLDNNLDFNGYSFIFHEGNDSISVFFTSKKYNAFGPAYKFYRNGNIKFVELLDNDEVIYWERYDSLTNKLINTNGDSLKFKKEWRDFDYSKAIILMNGLGVKENKIRNTMDLKKKYAID